MRKRRLRVFFARGLAALLPTLLTLFILITGFQFLDGYLAGDPLEAGAFALCRLATGLQILARRRELQPSGPGARWRRKALRAATLGS